MPADINSINRDSLLYAPILFRAQVSFQFPSLRYGNTLPASEDALTSLMLGIFGSSAAEPPKRSIARAVPINLAQTLRVT